MRRNVSARTSEDVAVLEACVSRRVSMVKKYVLPVSIGLSVSIGMEHSISSEEKNIHVGATRVVQ